MTSRVTFALSSWRVDRSLGVIGGALRTEEIGGPEDRAWEEVVGATATETTL